MKRPELYQKTVDILVDAYFNDTLEHGTQCGCAVGNLVAAGMGIKLTKIFDGKGEQDTVVPEYFTNANEVNTRKDVSNNGLWYDAICYKTVCEEKLTEAILQQVKFTGYSPVELSKIETAFESAPYSEDSDRFMFNGLMAVIEAIDKIHENTDTEVTQSSKNKFHKQLTPQT